MPAVHKSDHFDIRDKTAFVLISVEICAAVSGKLFKDLILVFCCIFLCVCKYDLPTPHSLPCMFGAYIYDAVLIRYGQTRPNS